MQRLSTLLWAAPFATAMACGAEPGLDTESLTDLGSAQQGIMDGYIDDTSHAVLGVGLSFGNRYAGWHCTGTLIAPNLVLTARHCVSLTQGSSVICGKTGFGMTGQGTMFRITTKTPRPDAGGGDHVFKGTGSVRPVPGNDLCGGDVAMILLADNVPAEVAEPIIPRIDRVAEAGELYSAVGFGLTTPNGRGNDIRYRLDEERITCVGEDCLSFGGTAQTYATEWNGTAATCSGDSGGPALDADGKVIGVLSRGPEGCVASLYGDVGSWGEFIIGVANEAAEMGGYPPPFWTLGSSELPMPGDPCDNTVTAPGMICDPPAEEGGESTWAHTCAAEGECPEGYQCDLDTGLCVDLSSLVETEPEPNTAATNGDTQVKKASGCSVETGASRGTVFGFGLLGALLLAHRQRRKSRAH